MKTRKQTGSGPGIGTAIMGALIAVTTVAHMAASAGIHVPSPFSKEVTDYFRGYSEEELKKIMNTRKSEIAMLNNLPVDERVTAFRNIMRRENPKSPYYRQNSKKTLNMNTERITYGEKKYANLSGKISQELK